jgi:glycosyltransferase involved in cell wall biosynthesis
MSDHKIKVLRVIARLNFGGPALERRAQKLGIAERVIFTGWRRDLPDIYADLDVLAVTSNNEGTPVSAIEAMAAGCPVVATHVGGLPDLISEGETGYLVPPGDASGLATAWLHVLQQLEMARRTGEAARKAAVERFSAQRLVTDMEQLYLELLGRKQVWH